jgi:DnaJ-class molecular chaperone
MPHVKDGKSGDQYVRLVGQLPQSLNEQETKLFKELASMRNGKR